MTTPYRRVSALALLAAALLPLPAVVATAAADPADPAAVAAAAPVAPIRLAVGEVLRGGFVQERHLAGFATPVQSQGHFVLAPGHGLIWRVETPFAVTTIITAAGLLQQNAAGGATTRLDAARLPFLSRLYAMLGGALAGELQALQPDFTIAEAHAGDTLLVTLTPHRAADPAMPIKAIKLVIRHYVESVDIVKADGDYDHISFTDQHRSNGDLTATETALLAEVGR